MCKGVRERERQEERERAMLENGEKMIVIVFNSFFLPK